MVQISNKSLCCGCAACVSRCPKHCITMKLDIEGFLYPKVDESDCIDCGLCEKVCHELHPYQERFPIKVLAANNKSTSVRLTSSSGGVFSILAEKVLSEDGIVFGARFDENWQVKLDYSETKEGVTSFRGSKYVQARTDTAYEDCERFLKENKKVLFTGTPCQIAGLKHFIRKDYENLITVDFVCHGTPSPKVWKRYLDETIDTVNKQLRDVRFRDKTDAGWKEFRLALDFEDKADSFTISVPNSDNVYMRAFLQDMILRPSCYNCKARCGRSRSDITIADFWGVQIHHPELDDDKGTSLVMINTNKGLDNFDLSQVTYVESTYDIALSHNPAISKSAKTHPRRDVFFKQLDTSVNMLKLIEHELKPSLKQRLALLHQRIKLLVKNILMRRKL